MPALICLVLFRLFCPQGKHIIKYVGVTKMYQDLRNINMKEYCRHKVKMGTYRQIAIQLKEKIAKNGTRPRFYFCLDYMYM